MVHPVKDGEEPTTFVVDGHADMQQSGCLAVAVWRRSYSIKEKRELVQAIRTLVSNGVSIRRACPLLGLPHQYYYRFKKVVQAADEVDASGRMLPPMLIFKGTMNGCTHVSSRRTLAKDTMRARKKRGWTRK